MIVKYDRTKNTIRNASFGLVLKAISMIGAFITRTMLIYLLGINYVGLDGLFTSVLTILNMAELGFSSAIVYKMYGPISEGKTDEVCALLNYYKKIYRYIGIFVFVLGIIFIPFLKYIIKDDIPSDINLYSLYFIYLFNTCLSYWLFAYKTALLNAHQRNDLASKVTSFIYVMKYLLQFILLLCFRNYYVYAIIIPLSTLLTNIGNAYIAKKFYPQYVCRGDISLLEKKEIKQKVSALLFNKLGVTIINGSDNIVISSFLGLSVLGIYNSYYYIFTLLYGVFEVFHNGMAGGVGNSIVTESIDANYGLFKRLSFINFYLVSWCSICMLCLYEPFMKMWIGSDNTLGLLFAILMCTYFYFWMIRFIVTIFKNAQGLWWEDRFRALIEGIFNLILNLIMVRVIGIYGITISTIVAMLLISLPWETHILFKKYFNQSMKKYMLTLIVGTLLTSCIAVLTYFLGSIIKIEGIVCLIYRGILAIVIPYMAFWILLRRCEDYRYMQSIFTRFVKKIVHR